METPILTPEESRAARAALGLSQGAVARETGINRTQLGLFEVSKYILSDKVSQTLRDYYEARSYRFHPRPEETQPPPENPLPVSETPGHDFEVVDGFCVGADLDPDAVDASLSEIAVNDEEIGRLVAEPAEEDWFDLWGDEFRTEKRDELLQLMARNYFLIRELQGREILENAEGPEAEQPVTNGDLVNNLFREIFNNEEPR